MLVDEGTGFICENHQDAVETNVIPMKDIVQVCEIKFGHR